VDQSTRQNLSMAFNTVLRTSALVGKIDQQRTSLAFAAFLESLPEGTNLVPLGPLYDFLLQQKAPEAAVRETLVYFQSREGRFGVTLQLPPQLASLSDEERGKIMLAMAARGQTSGPFAGAGGRHAPEPAPAAPPAPAAGGFTPDKKKKKAGQANKGRALVLALVLALVGLGGNLAYESSTRLPVPKEMKLDAGLPCATLLEADLAFLCYVRDSDLKTAKSSTLKPRADQLRNAAVARGLKARPVQVLSLESGDLVYVF
jgi:hypothetical protein